MLNSLLETENERFGGTRESNDCTSNAVVPPDWAIVRLVRGRLICRKSLAIVFLVFRACHVSEYHNYLVIRCAERR